jgi:hypothetical protein
MHRSKGRHGTRLRDIELSSLTNVPKQLMLKLGMSEGFASDRQQSRHQERVDIRTGGGSLEENRDASQRTAIRLVLPGRLLSILRLALPEVCYEQDG